MENLRKTIENISLGIACGSAALAGLTEIIEIDHFTNTPFWYVASGAAAAYLLTVGSDPEPRFNDPSPKPEYQSTLERPGLKAYNPEGK